MSVLARLSSTSGDLTEASNRHMTPTFDGPQEGPLGGSGDPGPRMVEGGDPVPNPFVLRTDLNPHGALGHLRENPLKGQIGRDPVGEAQTNDAGGGENESSPRTPERPIASHSGLRSPSMCTST